MEVKVVSKFEGSENTPGALPGGSTAINEGGGRPPYTDTSIVDSSAQTPTISGVARYPAREARVAKVLMEAPPLARGILERAFAGVASKRDAIKAQCLMCLDFNRNEITRCTGYSCPLWAYRPYQK